MSTKIMNYKITWDELELEDESKTPESLKPQLQSLHDDVMNGKSKVIPRLKKLITKHPSHVQLKNYLSAAYEKTGNLKKAMQVNDQILKEHPDYLFARINKASKLHLDGEYEEIPELLGKGFDLQVLYPHRDLFHISEFMGIQGMAVRYFSATGELVEAEKRLGIMKEMDEDAPQIELAEKIFYKAALEESLKRIAKEREECITPKNQFHLKKKNFKQPEFNIPITADLYHHEMDIPDEILQEFFDHDRDQVIEDLENVLKDSYYNYDPHKNRKHNWEPYAPVHAFFLLGDLEAEESLPVVLEMMEQSEDYQDDAFGDLITEAGWIPLFKMGKNQLDTLVEYLKLPGTYAFFKSSASDALEQIWYHFPAKRAEVEELFGELLEFLIHIPREDNVVDMVFNDLLISNLLNLKLVQFLPQIKNLYEKGYATDSMCGTFDDVKSEMHSNTPSSQGKRKLKTTKEVYKNFLPLTEPPSRIDHPERGNQPVVHTSKKIGRNDPCPCGSGKKYKKCCLYKNIF